MNSISLPNQQNRSQSFVKIEKTVCHPTDQDSIEIHYGSDNAFCNNARKICTFAQKFMLYDLEYASGDVSFDTVAKVAQYLKDHNLNNVSIEVNNYAPARYANRVFTNPNTSFFSKILLGSSDFVLYTLGVNRFLLGDHYDVMSNSVYLCSNDPDIGVFYSGVAEYFNQSKTPVLSAVLYPFKLLSGAPFATSSLFSTIHNNIVDWAKEKATEKELLRTSKVIRSLGHMEYALAVVLEISIIAGSFLSCRK